MKNFLIFVLLIVFVLFMYIAYINQPDEKNDLKQKMIYEFSKEQLKKRNLRLSAMGSGSSKVKDKFNLLIVDFETKNEITIAAGRRLLIEISKEFLENINQNKELEKHLFPYPFNIKGIEMDLSVSDPINTYKYYPEMENENKISYLFLHDGVIRYYIYITENGERQKVHQETYEEALKILEKENNVSI